MQQSILLVEDDHRLAQLVSSYLENNGFNVSLEYQGNFVADNVKRNPPDLIILDIGLPDRDGFSVCQELRAFYKKPILILTANDNNIDQVLGLELGADDYVIKPAEPRVLLARVKALLRRDKLQWETLKSAQSIDETPSDLQLGNLQINLRARQATLDQHPINLSSHEFDLLVALCTRAGEVLSREQLYQQLYHRDYDGLDRTLDVRISHLRKKLGDDSNNPTKIKTVWGRGYLLVPDAW